MSPCVYECVLGLSTKLLVHGVCHGRVEVGRRRVKGPGEVVDDVGKEQRCEGQGERVREKERRREQ